MGPFAPGTKLSEILTLAFDLILLNLIFILTCIPVITIGAAVTSLYKVAMQTATKRGGGITREYFAEFKASIIKGSGIFLAEIGVIGLLTLDLLIWRMFITDAAYTVVAVISFVLMALAIIISFWCFAILSRFENTFKQTIINGCMFALRYCVQTLIMMALTAGWIFLLLYFSYLWWLLVLFGFSLPAYLKMFYVNLKFKPFLPEDKEFEGISEI